MSFKRSGGLRKRSDMMMAWIVTDLPEPVVPAMRQCGIFATFTKCALPVMSRPSATMSGLGLSVYSGEARSDARPMVDFVELGTSIPTRDLPGIGASIRTGDAARASSRLVRRPTKCLSVHLLHATLLSQPKAFA